MIPLKDNIPHKNKPVVTVALILINVAVFLYQFSLEMSPEFWKGDIFVYYTGIVPAALQDREARDEALRQSYYRMETVVQDAQRGARTLEEAMALGAMLPRMEADYTEAIRHGPFLGIWTLLSSLFFHGGILHLLGNMWFLWIFGDNVEDRFGRFRFVLFYLFCGAAAGVTHAVLNPESLIPTIGASGAIGGVLGSYIYLYPRARVLTLIPFFFLMLHSFPAWVFLGIWFLIEWISTQQSLYLGPEMAGGVAHGAHVGGFLAGLLVTVIFYRKRPRRRRPSIDYEIR